MSQPSLCDPICACRTAGISRETLLAREAPGRAAREGVFCFVQLGIWLGRLLLDGRGHEGACRALRATSRSRMATHIVVMAESAPLRMLNDAPV